MSYFWAPVLYYWFPQHQYFYSPDAPRWHNSILNILYDSDFIQTNSFSDFFCIKIYAKIAINHN